MTQQTKMPEPVAQQIRHFDSNALSRTYGEWSEWKMFTGKYERMGMNQKRGLITTTQAEAYADARVREAQQWQPIETAPQGTICLFYNANATEVRSCMFVDWVVEGAFCGNRFHEATHWMPLPAPPLPGPASQT